LTQTDEKKNINMDVLAVAVNCPHYLLLKEIHRDHLWEAIMHGECFERYLKDIKEQDCHGEKIIRDPLVRKVSVKEGAMVDVQNLDEVSKMLVSWSLDEMSKMADAVCYGDKVKLINQYNPSKGYLDMCGHSNDGFGVSTSPSPNRDGGSGTWQVVENSQAGGTGPVKYGDMVKLVNQYDRSKGFLDTRGHSNDGFGVSTSPNPNRDNGSGTWQIAKNF